MSFMRCLSYISGKELAGVDLFSWAAATLEDKGFAEPLTLRTKALLDLDFAVTGSSSADISGKPVQPVCLGSSETGTPGSDFGIRFSRETPVVKPCEPDPGSLHRLLAKGGVSTFDEILKLLPMYVVPSQAERALEARGC